MVLDRWDPGIDTESRIRLGLQGQRQIDGKERFLNQRGGLERGSFLDLQRIAKEKAEDREAISGKSCIDLLGIGKSVIIKTEIQYQKGKSDDYLLPKSRNSDGEITKDLLDLITSALWKVIGCFSIYLHSQSLYSKIFSRDMIRKIKFDKFEGFSLLGKRVQWNRYKKEAIHDPHSITFITISLNQFTKALFLFSFSSLMAQGQLVGKNGDLKNEEGARKRLRISVPHFDNTEIIKNYARTLVGRCMNPVEQNMAALVTNLQNFGIWKIRLLGQT